MPRRFETIHGNANICIWVLFNRTTELLSESSCFDCQKVIETNYPCWPCAGLKVNFRKVSQEGATEASDRVCCYQAGKRTKLKIAFTESEDLKNSWSFPSKSQVLVRAKKLSTMFSNVHESLCKGKCHVNCK